MNMQIQPALETFRSQDPCKHRFEGLMRRFGGRQLFAVLMGLIMLALSGHASAQNNCTGTSQTFTIPMPASITVPANAVVGTTLSTAVTSPNTANFSCFLTVSGNIGTAVQGVSLTPSGISTGQGPAWTTNVQGVGMTISATMLCGPAAPMVGFHDIPASWQSYCYSGTGTYGAQFTVTLVKTGPITPGTITERVIVQAAGRVQTNSTITYNPIMSFAISPTAVVAPTCAFSVPNIALGSFSADSFTGNTSTPEISVPVTATSCPSDARAINMSFTGTADSTNPALFAANSVTGNVTGVGIGLKYAPPSQAPAAVTPNVTTGTWTLASGNTMQLLANFVQTRPNVSGGTVSTPITIQFTYQ